jgi:hypothetical protein
VQLDSVMRYLAYPANLASGIFIVFASVLLSAALSVGMFGLPLASIMLTWFFKYALVTVEHICWKVEGEPVLSVEMIHPLQQGKSFVLLIITGIFFAIFYAAQYWAGPVAGAAIGLAAVGLLPAVVAVQTATDTALLALDPRQWYRLLRWLKQDYLLVLAAILVFWIFAFALVFFEPISDHVYLVIKIALLMFGWLSALSLLGGVILEKRIADPDDSPMERAELEVSSVAIQRERERKIDSIYGEWRSGAQKNAWQTLMRTVEASDSPVDELRWMLDRISTWEEPRLAERVAQELVPRLLAISRFGEAISVTRQRLAVHAGYRPVTATETLRMVRVARDGGDRPTARALLSDFRQIFPNDALIPVAEELARDLQR